LRCSSISDRPSETSSAWVSSNSLIPLLAQFLERLIEVVGTTYMPFKRPAFGTPVTGGAVAAQLASVGMPRRSADLDGLASACGRQQTRAGVVAVITLI